MSVEDLKTYGRLATEDPVVRETVNAIGVENTAEHIAYAQTLGLQITEGDFAALARESLADGELGDEELEQVTGGFTVSSLIVDPGKHDTTTSTTTTTATSSGNGGW